MITRILVPWFLLTVLARADDAVLESWLKRQSGIQSIEASFVQERKLPSLKRPASTPGLFVFAKPDRIRWQLGDPPATIALSDGTTLTLIDTAARTARRIPIDSPQAARFTLLTGKGFQSPEDFHRLFEVVEQRIDSGIHQFTLKAKDRSTRAQVPWVFLSIDPDQNTLVAMELELQDKSRIRTVFKNPRFNIKPAESRFTEDLTGYSVK